MQIRKCAPRILKAVATNERKAFLKGLKGNIAMQGILYEEPSIWLFILVTCLMGGWAAWMAGRACAKTWRPLVIVIFYMLLLGIAVRFIHFALFGGTMFTLHYYIVDTIVLTIIRNPRLSLYPYQPDGPAISLAL